jgi:hypothetical protein
MKIYYANRFEDVLWIELAQTCSVKLTGSQHLENILKLT